MGKNLNFVNDGAWRRLQAATSIGYGDAKKRFSAGEWKSLASDTESIVPFDESRRAEAERESSDAEKNHPPDIAGRALNEGDADIAAGRKDAARGAPDRATLSISFDLGGGAAWSKHGPYTHKLGAERMRGGAAGRKAETNGAPIRLSGADEAVDEGAVNTANTAFEPFEENAVDDRLADECEEAQAETADSIFNWEAPEISSFPEAPEYRHERERNAQERVRRLHAFWSSSALREFDRTHDLQWIRDAYNACNRQKTKKKNGEQIRCSVVTLARGVRQLARNTGQLIDAIQQSDLNKNPPEDGAPNDKKRRPRRRDGFGDRGSVGLGVSLFFGALGALAAAIVFLAQEKGDDPGAFERKFAPFIERFLNPEVEAKLLQRLKCGALTFVQNINGMTLGAPSIENCKAGIRIAPASASGVKRLADWFVALEGRHRIDPWSLYGVDIRGMARALSKREGGGSTMVVSTFEALLGRFEQPVFQKIGDVVGAAAFTAKYLPTDLERDIFVASMAPTAATLPNSGGLLMTLGPSAASYAVFGKSLDDLTNGEIAVLVASAKFNILIGDGYMNARFRAKANEDDRKLIKRVQKREKNLFSWAAEVIRRAERKGVISAAEAEKARAELPAIRRKIEGLGSAGRKPERPSEPTEWLRHHLGNSGERLVESAIKLDKLGNFGSKTLVTGLDENFQADALHWVEGFKTQMNAKRFRSKACQKRQCAKALGVSLFVMRHDEDATLLAGAAPRGASFFGPVVDEERMRDDAPVASLLKPALAAILANEFGPKRKYCADVETMAPFPETFPRNDCSQPAEWIGIDEIIAYSDNSRLIAGLSKVSEERLDAYFHALGLTFKGAPSKDDKIVRTVVGVEVGPSSERVLALYSALLSISGKGRAPRVLLNATPKTYLPDMDLAPVFSAETRAAVRSALKAPLRRGGTLAGIAGRVPNNCIVRGKTGTADGPKKRATAKLVLLSVNCAGAPRITVLARVEPSDRSSAAIGAITSTDLGDLALTAALGASRLHTTD